MASGAAAAAAAEAVEADAAAGAAGAEADMVGVGYRLELADWIDAHPTGLDCLEITAEHFYEGGKERLSHLSKQFRLFVHGLGLSLGTPGRLDQERLERFAEVAAIARAEWISEHVAFTCTPEVDLGHLNPVPLTREMVELMADHARELSKRCGPPLLLENITSHLRLEGELSETEFLNDLCAQANCGLLLDVTNLFINSKNHRFDPLRWLHELEPGRIQQLHIVGYSRQGDRYTDDHSQSVQDELLELAGAVMAYAPVQAIILERDAQFPSPEIMEEELAKLATLDGPN